MPASHTAKALREYDSTLGSVRWHRGAGCSYSLSLRERAGVRVSGGQSPHPNPLPQAGERSQERRQSHPDRQRPRAQPQVALGRHPAQQVQRGHRRVGLGQVHARLRHPVQRRTAALPRIAQCLRAQHRAAGGPARSGCGLRHSADGGDRAAALARRAQVHRGHDHRGLAFPAPAVRQARRAALRQRRRRSAAADAGQHRRAADAALPRPAHRPAGAAGDQPQGRVHRAGGLGPAARLHAPARGRQFPADHTAFRASTASRNTRSSCRCATST